MLIYYTDINECLIDNDGCEFSCTNFEGINNTTGLGYQCGCDNGYQLAPNNHDCNGMCVYVCESLWETNSYENIGLLWEYWVKDFNNVKEYNYNQSCILYPHFHDIKFAK